MIWAKRILVPVDFSPCSQLALRYAMILAERFNAEVHVLHVLEGVRDDDSLLARDEVEAHMTQAIARVAPTAKLRVHLAGGRAADAIIRHARAGNYDLIAIGRYGFASPDVGSVSREVMDRAPCDVVPMWEQRPAVSTSATH